MVVMSTGGPRPKRGKLCEPALVIRRSPIKKTKEGPMTVLIVEDNALIAMTVEATLSEAGYKVLGPAPSTERAIAIAEQIPPRIALLNMQLQDGSSGVELARTLKQRWGTTVIFLTGQAVEARELRGVAIGFLAKPCTDEALLATITIVDQIIAGEKPDRATFPKGLQIF
jgi:DNA-binding response OmpR family regulator